MWACSCAQTHTGMPGGAYTEHSMCTYARLQQQTGAQPGGSLASQRTCVCAHDCEHGVLRTCGCHAFLAGRSQTPAKSVLNTPVDRLGWMCIARQGSHTQGAPDPPTE